MTRIRPHTTVIPVPSVKDWDCEFLGISQWLSHEQSARNGRCRRHGFNPRSQEDPWEGIGNSLRHSCLGKSWTEEPEAAVPLNLRAGHNWVADMLMYSHQADGSQKAHLLRLRGQTVIKDLMTLFMHFKHHMKHLKSRAVMSCE